MKSEDFPDVFPPFSEEGARGSEECQKASIEVLRTNEGDSNMRLDVFLASRLGVTRSFARKLIEDGNVRLSSQKRAKPGLKVSADLSAEVFLPPPESLDLEPEEVPFGVIYADEWLIVVNKPSGLVVHPAPGNWHGTLVHGLLHRFRDFGAFNNVLRPGIVHRLDAPTSGLLVVAKEQSILENLQRQFKERQVEKRYLALVHGKIKEPQGRIELPIRRCETNRFRMAVVPGGRVALTEYRVLWCRSNYSFLECRIATGRTHQIRVHLSYIGHPLVGDGLYGADKNQATRLGRVFLHSWKLSFLHPHTGERLLFTALLPAALIGRLREVLSTNPA